MNYVEALAPPGYMPWGEFRYCPACHTVTDQHKVFNGRQRAGNVTSPALMAWQCHRCFMVFDPFVEPE